MRILITYGMLLAILFVLGIVIDMRHAQSRKNIGFMSIQHTEVIKGVAILCVVLSHIGNANETRLFAPGGGIGVALFLICSGYGLNESSKKGFTILHFWKKRIVTVFLPYALIRTFMVIADPNDITVLDFLFDITCIKPLYGLGWYLNYLLLFYVVFTIYQLSKRRFQQKSIFIIAIAASISFIVGPTELQAEQCLSFITGVVLSEYKIAPTHKKAPLDSWKEAVVAFLVGALAFILKRVNIFESIHWIYFIQVIYKYSWAVMLVLVVWIVIQRVTLKPAATFGKYSYEIYLIHGYMFHLMKSIANIPIFVLFIGVSSMVLHCLIKYLSRIAK